MTSQLNSANHFLASLSAHDSELIKPHLHPMELPHEAILYKAEDTISRLYFPHSGVVSLIVGFANGQFVEAGMLGRNSVIGTGAALDGGVAARAHSCSRRRGAPGVVLRMLCGDQPAIPSPGRMEFRC
jgi:CRP-like cAMP-binding protein